MAVQQSPRDISGLWVQGTDEKPDAALGDIGTHGTYTRSIYLRFVHVAGPSDDYEMLYVFNEAGEMASFKWSNDFESSAFRGAWVTYSGWLTFRGGAESLGGTDLTLSLTLSIAPNLTLWPKDKVPESFRDTGCPMAFGTPTIDSKLIGCVGGAQPACVAPIDSNLIVGIGSEPPQLPTGLRARPVEYIRADEKDALTWCQRDDNGADTIEIQLQRPAKPQPAGPTWGALFVSSYLKSDAVFVGYKLAEVDLYNGDMTGTAQKSSPGGPVSGPRLFKYPDANSTDIQKSSAGDDKFLPVGTLYYSITAGQESNTTVIIASENQHCKSTALTLGLEGGVEGATKAGFSLSQESKTEKESSQQFRYTQSTETYKQYALVRDLANLALDPDYANSLRTKFTQLLPSVVEAAKLSAQGQDPKSAKSTLTDDDWTAFEGTNGSHYANAVTFGNVKYLKTTLTEKTEGFLVENSIGLKAAATGAFDGFTGGPDVDVKSTWGDKFTNAMSRDDLHSFFIGKDDAPAPIFLDLRPLNDLLNPILLPWNAGPLADNDEIRAPFMWYLLRRHYLDYQRRVHLIDASVSALPDKDWSPVSVRFHASVQIVVDEPWPVAPPAVAPHGRISWTPYGGATVAATNSYYRPAADSHFLPDGGGMLPGATDLTCTLIADSTTAAESGVGLTVDLLLWTPAGQPDMPFDEVTLKMPMNGPNGEEFDGRGYTHNHYIKPDHYLVRLRREIVPSST